ASILLVAVLYVLARQLYKTDSVGTMRALSAQIAPLIAMFLMAVSPFALAFSATVFTDGLMLLCIILALWMASRGQWLWAGVWLALGYACKQQALFYLPLIIAIGWVMSERAHLRVSLQKVIRLALPLLTGFILLGIWDAARAQDSSLWALA